MIIRELEPAEAIEFGRTMPYALIRTLSEVSLGHTPPELPSPEEILEARFFSADAEVRIVLNGETLCAALLSEEPGAETVDRTLTLQNPQFGKSVSLRHLIRYDEDGQASLSSGRLYDWKEGAQNA